MELKINIFALDKDPRLAAQYHCNKHVVKMILESCQLLSTAHRLLDGEFYVGKTASNRNIKRWRLADPHLDNYIYSATHVSHPSAIWCRENIAQYMWLATLTLELCVEYTYRYGKTHKCQTDGLVQWFIDNVPNNIKKDDFVFTYPTPAMPAYCKVPGDVIASYRTYYVNEKQRMHEWCGKVANRDIPFWIFDPQYVAIKEAA